MLTSISNSTVQFSLSSFLRNWTYLYKITVSNYCQYPPRGQNHVLQTMPHPSLMSSFLMARLCWRGLSGFQTSQGDNSRWPPQTSSTSPWHRCIQTWFMGRTSLSFIHILVRGILCHRHIATHLALSFKLWNHRFLDKGSILWKGNSDLCGDRRQAKQPFVCRPAHQRTQVLIFWAYLV